MLKLIITNLCGGISSEKVGGYHRNLHNIKLWKLYKDTIQKMIDSGGILIEWKLQIIYLFSDEKWVDMFRSMQAYSCYSKNNR